MKSNVRVLVGLAMIPLTSPAMNPGTIREELKAPQLDAKLETLAYVSVYNAIVEKDVAADLAWTQIRTREEYDAYRKAMQAKMIAAIGGLPERTPLNPVVTGVVKRKGYRVEKLYFESLPGLYVTANLFVPEDLRFSSPYPGVILALGHSDMGKGGPVYQRAGVKAALAGFAALTFDPIDQGERFQTPHYGSNWYPVGTQYGMGHNAIGIRAMLLGDSMAQIRIWDAMRAIDYLTSRTDVVRPGKIGYMGTSGGGTSTALMMALDDRIGAAAPSCFITSYRALLNGMAPQDAEQQIYGMLGFGLNHLGFFLMGDVPGAVTSGHVDGFPHYGTYESFRIASDLAGRLGCPDRYALVDMPGGHGWSEGNLDASFDWMRAWLCGERERLPLDMARHRETNVGADRSKMDCGLAYEDCAAAPQGDVRNLPGSRDAYVLLNEKLDRALAARKNRTPAELSALVRRLAVIRSPSETDVRVKTLLTKRVDGGTAERIVFSYPNGMTLPSVLFVPDGAKGAPAITFADNGGIWWGRICTAAFVEKLTKAGRPVLAVDLTACGEPGEAKHNFYGCGQTNHPEEAVGVMLYILGESLVGRRATDILVAADYMKNRFGASSSLHAVGRVAIAAAHARAADPSLVSSVESVETPKSWVETVKSDAYMYYSDCVQGALLEYDWKDLLK